MSKELSSMQVLAAEFSGWRRKIPLLFEKKTLNLKQFVRIHVFKNPALKWTRSVCLSAL